jgi:phosphate:Na+ symporter
MLKRISVLTTLLLLISSSFWAQNATLNEDKKYINNVKIDEIKEAVTVKWTFNCEELETIQATNTNIVVRYITKNDKKKLDNDIEGVSWSYTAPLSSDSTSLVITDLVGDESYYFQVGLFQDTNGPNYENAVWSDKESGEPKAGWNFFKLLVLIGSLGFFIFGMKTMSEGIQKLAGQKLQSILGAATSNRFAGVLTGFTTTSIIQSSSATTVMVVSFVNAGLLNLRQAIGVIMGANIGTTVTSFLILAFGFGKFSISDYSLPIIAFGMPMLFINKSFFKSLGEFLIGFAILFMGLDALKEVMSFIKDDPSFLYNVVEPLTSYGFMSVILFVFIGTVLTIIVQSSSAAMAITLALCGTNGLPLEYGAAIILGENIGTTITAYLASLIGNVHAKRAARAHLLFNVIGVVWMLIVFYPFLEFINILITDTFFSSLVKDGDKTSSIRWSLAVFHLIFNLINTFLLIWFVGNLEKLVVKLVPSKDESDEEFKLDFIGGSMGSTAELCILEAKKEVSKFGNVASRMNNFTKTIVNSSDKKEKKKLLKKLGKYEEITDRVEEEIVNYIGKVSQMEMSASTSTKTRAMLSIGNDLERIGDIYYQIAKSFEKKEQENVWFSPEQRDGVNTLLNKIGGAFEIMNTNLNSTYGDISMQAAIDAEKDIKKTRKFLKRQHMESVKDGEFNIKTVLIYNDLIHNLDKISDHIINVSEAVAGENLN